MAERERQFEGTVFLDFAKSLFVLFLRSRHKGDLTPLRSHFAPGLYKAWQNLADSRPNRRLVTRPMDYDVQTAELIDHYQAGDLELAIVVLAGLAIPGDPHRQSSSYPLREKWIFTRPAELAGQPCPVCGRPWTLTQWGKCRFCNRDFSGTNDGWTVSGAENLNPSQDPFAQELAFLNYWDDALRIVQSRPGQARA
jgi:hypothetical protein